MMKNILYDTESDAITVKISPEKSDHTAEFTEHILIDLTSKGKIISVEILDASEEISKLFGRAVPKKEIRQLLCQIKHEPENEYLIQFRSPQKNELATLIIPLYRSPLIS